MSTSSSTEDDTESSSQSEDDHYVPPPIVQPGKVMCWCTKCVGMVLQHAWKADEHIQNWGRHQGQFAGASSSRQVWNSFTL